MCLFGNVVCSEMVFTEAGSMINKLIYEFSEYIPKIQINDFIVMPNHIHMVILFTESIGPAQRPAPTGNRFGLPAMVSRFKSISTTRYIEGVSQFGWPPFSEKLWQRGYYEHIIRNDRDHQAIIDYIEANPINWEKDKENQ